jgi:hypothetical protein
VEGLEAFRSDQTRGDPRGGPGAQPLGRALPEHGSAGELGQGFHHFNSVRARLDLDEEVEILASAL